jgi:APA family basic amino acid/polyamine antiporter
MIGMLVSTIIYMVGSVSIMGIIPAHILAHSPTPYADAAEIMIGHNAKYWISAGMAIAAFGAINGWILMQGQLGFGVAKDKLFPQVFALTNKRNVPWFSIMVNAIVVCVIVAMNYSKGLIDQFKAIMLLSVLTTVVPYLFSAAAYPIIKANKRPGKGTAVAIVLAIIAFAYSLWAIAGTGQNSVYYGFILLMLGIPFYVWITYRKNKAL